MSKEEKKAKAYFKQIFPHINLIQTEMDKLHQEVFDNKKKCFVLKGSIQDSMNRLKDESNKIIKEIVEDIYSIRELYLSDAKGYGSIMEEILRDLEKNKEETRKIKKDVHNCERRIKHCENEIGYNLLESYNNSTPLPNQTNKEDDQSEKPLEEEKDKEEIEKELTQSDESHLVIEA